MPRHDETPVECTWPQFVPSRAGEQPDWLRDRTRYVLWQATGRVIDDTTFGPTTDPTITRWWFPPCTHQMTPQWWAKMRAAAERVEEAFRSGTNLHTHNFAEEVVVATVLRSDAPQEIIDSLVDDEHDQYATLVDCGDDDLDFANVLADMADDGDAELLFPDDFRGSQPPVVCEAVRGDLERWFDPYDHARPCA